MANGLWIGSVNDSVSRLAANQARITVTDPETDDLLGLYQDRAGTKPLGNPFLTREDGLVKFFVRAGRVNISAIKGGIEQVFENEIILDDWGDINDPVPTIALTNISHDNAQISIAISGEWRPLLISITPKYRLSGAEDWTALTAISPEATTYIYSEVLDTETEYEFAVDADYAGESLESNIVSGETDAPPAVARNYWRIRITANNGDTYTGIAEIQFRATEGGADQVPMLTTATTNEFASSSFSANPPWRAFDDSTGSSWFNNGGGSPLSDYIGYHFSTAVEVKQVAITVNNTGSNPARGPKDFEIQYSDDGVTYTTALTVTNQVGWSSSSPETRLFTIP